MAEAAAAPPPLETKVGYSADGKRVVLTCSMRVPDICSAPSKAAKSAEGKAAFRLAQFKNVVLVGDGP